MFQPAQGTGYDYFVEVVGCSCGCRYGYLVLCLGLGGARWCVDVCDGFIEADVGFCDGVFGNVFQDAFVCRCHDEVALMGYVRKSDMQLGMIW